MKSLLRAIGFIAIFLLIAFALFRSLGLSLCPEKNCTPPSPVISFEQGKIYVKADTSGPSNLKIRLEIDAIPSNQVLLLDTIHPGDLRSVSIPVNVKSVHVRMRYLDPSSNFCPVDVIVATISNVFVVMDVVIQDGAVPDSTLCNDCTDLKSASSFSGSITFSCATPANGIVKSFKIGNSKLLLISNGSTLNLYSCNKPANLHYNLLRQNETTHTSVGFDLGGSPYTLTINSYSTGLTLTFQATGGSYQVSYCDSQVQPNSL